MPDRYTVWKEHKPGMIGPDEGLVQICHRDGRVRGPYAADGVDWDDQLDPDNDVVAYRHVIRKPKWEIERAGIDSDRLTELLADGWEPMTAVAEPYEMDGAQIRTEIMVILRRKVS
jgi:hypothetical protein